MAIHVALKHVTHYRYDRMIGLSPQVVRLRPAPHCRTPILSYSLKVEPTQHFVNWMQDPFANYQARLVFPDKTNEFKITVDLVAEMAVYNPFDFFLEPTAEKYPFKYDPELARELAPYMVKSELTPHLKTFVDSVDVTKRRTIDFLVDLNQLLQREIRYVIRMEPGVQTPEETLTLASGSCRDSGWLMVQTMRHLGLAARFVSGYLIQLTPDVKALDGPSGTEVDFTDLHAWCEVFLPGAGWIGLDPTSGLMAGEGHIPLACTPEPGSAAPVTGALDECEVEFEHLMSVSRIYESPRVTKPYSEEQWQAVLNLGSKVDEELLANDVRLTQGGEPTFVSVSDRDGAEWNTTALGPTKRGFATELVQRLRDRYGSNGFLHFGQGKWYPGEQLPRWALSIFWRKDGEPCWHNPELFADERIPASYTSDDAKRFIEKLTEKLALDKKYIQSGYEDVWYYLWRERRLPVNVDPFDSRLEDEMERARLRRIFDQGLDKVVGYVLPIKREWNFALAGPKWMSGPWFFRDERMYLFPGDSPMGYRLPLDSLPWVTKEEYPHEYEQDPFAPRSNLPSASFLRHQYAPHSIGGGFAEGGVVALQLGADGNDDASSLSGLGDKSPRIGASKETADHGQARGLSGLGYPGSAGTDVDGSAANSDENSAENLGEGKNGTQAAALNASPNANTTAVSPERYPDRFESASWMTRTALCVEVRDPRRASGPEAEAVGVKSGVLYVFMPPLQHLEDYLDLLAAVEATAEDLGVQVVLEGYPPPRDPRLKMLQVTPDPGVIEVNIHPASNWDELVDHTEFLYQAAHETRLSTEKFMLDGRHTGTGGGNHFVLGGATAADSPFLRRPDLLSSLIAYWHNHPSLSYLFSGLFIGPTSQAPRVDEARNDQLYELELAFSEIQRQVDLLGNNPNAKREGYIPPWLVDRILRNILIDVTGNTHRSEFCIDKLYSPDGPAGRLGLLELRAFEMPPHARMSLTQQLLLRALIIRFWKTPYTARLTRWGTELHDRFLLPTYVAMDFEDVIADMNEAGYAFDYAWFAPHFEFRFPLFGQVKARSIELSIRGALEPWHVMGEEGSPGGTVRYVDSSLERIEIRATGLNDSRYVITVNGRAVPMQSTGRVGEYVSGVRYRAWNPPSALHPTIGVHAPLVFDIVDTWSQRSLGGCQYHVAHPGGRSYETFPINAYEAESRRLARFVTMGHTPGKMVVEEATRSKEFPFSLDMRR